MELDRTWTNTIIEFIGTFVFLSVIMNVAMKGNGGVFTPLAIGLALTVSIYMLIYNGATCHFNPAVSFMSWLRGDTPLKVLGMFIAAQLAGAGAAFALHKYIIKE